MKVNDNIHRFHEKNESKWLVVSDVHYDSRKCNRKMLKAHFDRAKAEGRRIAIVGDWFDVMGAYRDPRSKPADIRPEYYTPDTPYFDAIVQDSADFLSNYKDNIAVVFYGNHETNINKRHDHDILRATVVQAGISPDVLSQYWGFIGVQMKTSRKHSKTFLMACHHGYGGNSPRSKGVLKNQIDGFKYPQADAIFSGHTHQKWHDPSNVRVIMDGDNIRLSTQHVFCCGSYKECSKEGFGWEAEKGFLPTRSGGWFVDLTAKCKNGIVDVQLKAEEAQ
jgi:predicted phosphodiesterase